MKRFAVILLSVLLSFGARAASDVSGKVVDQNGQPIIGAVVVVGGDTSTGVATDFDGLFSVKASIGDELKVMSLGYSDVTVKLTSTDFVTVKMGEDVNMLAETVVIGYGSAKKSDLTGSVVNVKMNDIKDTPMVSVDNALQGRIAGADFMSTDGAPGSTTTIRIRGTRSITASNEPLIVVDGVMDAINDLNDINTDDIQSISVLKDASSTAIYGSRGANGVIIITTKHGLNSDGKPNITLKADAGVSTLPTKLDIMNAAEFAMYRNDYAYFGGDPLHSGVSGTTPLSGSVYPDPLSLGQGTDWIGEITRPAAVQNYSLSLGGGKKDFNYFASVSYNDTQGIIQGSGQKRLTARVSFDINLFKWLKIGYSGSYTYRTQDIANASIGGTAWYNSAQYLSPLIKPGDSMNPLYNGGQRINTPRMLIDLNTYNKKYHSTNHSVKLDFEPVEKFKISSTLSYFLYQNHVYRYYPGTLPQKSENQGGDAYREESDKFSLSSETTASYLWEKGKHTLTPMIGWSAYKSAGNKFNLSGSGYMDDEVLWNNMNAVLDKETYSAGTSYAQKIKMSAFARIDYNYDHRYYITATGRYDGASNFADNHKWAFFPSAALRWNISNEPWMKGASRVDNLSLRASAGMTGNDAISEYRSLAALSSTTSGYVFDQSQPVAFYRSRLATPDLTWEKTALYNVALDANLLDSRINFTGELYWSKTTDLLLTVQTAAQTGYTSRYANIGTTTNRGWEITLETININRRNFSWSTSLTMSHNKQLVLDIGSEDFVAAYSSPGNNPYMMYGYVSGYPLNSLWGFKYAGVWHSQDEIQMNEATKTYASASSKALGYARYYDINHDGTLNQDDLVYQGNADPYLFGGLQNTFYIYGFRLGVYFAYSLGGKIYNYSELYMAGSVNTNQYRFMLDSWHPVRNPESNIPRAGSTDVSLPSDFMIYDASYLRLKTLTLSYTFNFKNIKWMKDLTLTLTGDNLWLGKNYNGFDPDVSSEGTSSTLRRLDVGAYPKARTFTFSIQFKY
ncbi:MAG: TonB-dependent receptor [Bacteroidales bacterium]|nr:TonB-dependent receptor [Bacteroidales bacterium]